MTKRCWIVCWYTMDFFLGVMFGFILVSKIYLKANGKANEPSLPNIAKAIFHLFRMTLTNQPTHWCSVSWVKWDKIDAENSLIPKKKETRINKQQHKNPNQNRTKQQINGNNEEKSKHHHQTVFTCEPHSFCSCWLNSTVNVEKPSPKWNSLFGTLSNNRKVVVRFIYFFFFASLFIVFWLILEQQVCTSGWTRAHIHTHARTLNFEQRQAQAFR